MSNSPPHEASSFPSSTPYHPFMKIKGFEAAAVDSRAVSVEGASLIPSVGETSLSPRSMEGTSSPPRSMEGTSSPPTPSLSNVPLLSSTAPSEELEGPPSYDPSPSSTYSSSPSFSDPSYTLNSLHPLSIPSSPTWKSAAADSSSISLTWNPPPSDSISTSRSFQCSPPCSIPIATTSNAAPYSAVGGSAPTPPDSASAPSKRPLNATDTETTPSKQVSTHLAANTPLTPPKLLEPATPSKQASTHPPNNTALTPPKLLDPSTPSKQASTHPPTNTPLTPPKLLEAPNPKGNTRSINVSPLKVIDKSIPLNTMANVLWGNERVEDEEDEFLCIFVRLKLLGFLKKLKKLAISPKRRGGFSFLPTPQATGNLKFFYTNKWLETQKRRDIIRLETAGFKRFLRMKKKRLFDENKKLGPWYMEISLRDDFDVKKLEELSVEQEALFNELKRRYVYLKSKYGFLSKKEKKQKILNAQNSIPNISLLGSRGAELKFRVDVDQRTLLEDLVISPEEVPVTALVSLHLPGSSGAQDIFTREQYREFEELWAKKVEDEVEAVKISETIEISRKKRIHSSREAYLFSDFVESRSFSDLSEDGIECNFRVDKAHGKKQKKFLCAQDGKPFSSFEYEEEAETSKKKQNEALQSVEALVSENLRESDSSRSTTVGSKREKPPTHTLQGSGEAYCRPPVWTFLRRRASFIDRESTQPVSQQEGSVFAHTTEDSVKRFTFTLPADFYQNFLRQEVEEEEKAADKNRTKSRFLKDIYYRNFVGVYLSICLSINQGLGMHTQWSIPKFYYFRLPPVTSRRRCAYVWGSNIEGQLGVLCANKGFEDDESGFEQREEGGRYTKNEDLRRFSPPPGMDEENEEDEAENEDEEKEEDGSLPLFFWRPYPLNDYIDSSFRHESLSFKKLRFTSPIRSISCCSNSCALLLEDDSVVGWLMPVYELENNRRRRDTQEGEEEEEGCSANEEVSAEWLKKMIFPGVPYRFRVRDGDGKEVTPISIEAGDMTTAVITAEEGRLLMWGNSPFGQLGCEEDWVSPRYIEISPHLPVKQVKLSKEAVLCLTNDGSVYTWGKAPTADLLKFRAAPIMVSEGSIPIVRTPHRISEFNSSGVTFIEAGAYTFAAITEDGSLWTWGSGLNHQLGHNIPVLSEAEALDEGSFEDEEGARGVRSTHTQRGHILGELSWPVPKKVEFFEKSLRMPILTVSMGWYHTAAIDVLGNVYTWGFSSHGQCGLGDWLFARTPKQLSWAMSFKPSLPSSSKCIGVSCGGLHTIFAVVPGRFHTHTAQGGSLPLCVGGGINPPDGRAPRRIDSGIKRGFEGPPRELKRLATPHTHHQPPPQETPLFPPGLSPLEESSPIEIKSSPIGEFPPESFPPENSPPPSSSGVCIVESQHLNSSPITQQKTPTTPSNTHFGGDAKPPRGVAFSSSSMRVEDASNTPDSSPPSFPGSTLLTPRGGEYSLIYASGDNSEGCLCVNPLTLVKSLHPVLIPPSCFHTQNSGKVGECFDRSGEMYSHQGVCAIDAKCGYNHTIMLM